MAGKVELKIKAKEQLKGKWALSIITLLVALLLCDGISRGGGVIDRNGGWIAKVCFIIGILLNGAITLGACKFLVNIVTNTEEARFSDLFSGFNIYLKTLGLSIVRGIMIGIASLILIVPGIILGLMFSQAFFILCEDNKKSIGQCLQESSKMMKGHKNELFMLILSFIGWGLLICVTFGVALLWVKPYFEVTLANYYLELKNS